MGKIDVSVKINDRGLLESEQRFISLWLKFLELTLEAGISVIVIKELQITVENLKRYTEGKKGGL